MVDQIKPANQCDHQALLRFINGPQLSFEHLDWWSSRARLNEDSTYALFDNQQIAALLSVSPETDQFAWIRFFFALRDGRHKLNFQTLFQHSLNWLQKHQVGSLFSLANSNWLENLLVENGFELSTKIISLSLTDPESSDIEHPEGMILRSMTYADLKQVQKLDHLCFEPPWQLNSASLEKCYFKGCYSSVIYKENELLAYQISTQFLDQVHLARAAVHPVARGHHLATLLIMDLLRECGRGGTSLFTVNTQIDNQPSIHLYQKLGFKKTEDFVPVYCYDFS